MVSADPQGEAGTAHGAGTTGEAGTVLGPGAAAPTAGLRDLLPLLRPHRRPLVLAAGLSLAAGAAALAQPALVGRVIAAVGAGESLLPAVVSLVVVLIAGALLGAVQ